MPDPRETRDPTRGGRLGDAADARFLVLHADDFGMSHSVNRATALAFDHGWITSASVMVPCPWFPEVVSFHERRPDACLGVHLTLNSEWTGFRWGPVAPTDRVSSLLDARGYLPCLASEIVGRARIEEVEIELSAQVDKARAAGIVPTHFDSHMATLSGSSDLFATYLAMGKKYGVPLRVGAAREHAVHSALLDPTFRLVDDVLEITPEVPATEWPAAYETLLAPLAPGFYQLTLHLGFDDDELRGATHDHPSWGAAWRQRDLALVRSPRFRRFLSEEGFTLVSWRDLARTRVEP
jgi:hypothetical protein